MISMPVLGWGPSLHPRNTSDLATLLMGALQWRLLRTQISYGRLVVVVSEVMGLWGHILVCIG